MHRNQPAVPPYATLERPPDSALIGEAALSVRRTSLQTSWLLFVLVGVLAVTTLPYVMGFLAAPAGQEFAGALNNTGDLAQYLAMIRQGAEGHWLYRDQFTSLNAPHVLIYPLYALCGQTLGHLGLAPLAVFQIARIIADVGLIVALYWFCGIVFATRAARRFAMTLALASSGLYWLALALSGPLAGWDVQPAQLTTPELSVLTTLLGAPHVAVGLAAQLLTFGCFLRALRLGMAPSGRRASSWWWAFAAAVSGVVVGLSYPFNLLPIDCVLAGVALWSAWRAYRATMQAQSWRTLALAALVAAPSLPIAIYYFLLFSRDPVWRTSGMATSAPASPLVYLLAFGPLAVLSLPALSMLVRRTPIHRVPGPLAPTRDTEARMLPEAPIVMVGDAWILVALWAIVPLVLLCVPLWQAGRVANGWSVALALLSAATLLRLTGGLRARQRAILRRRWVVGLSFSNILLVMIYCSLTLSLHPADYYVPRDLASVAAWLDRHAGAHDVVLASAGSGNVIAARSDVAVVAGQNFQTFNLAASLRAVADFYNPATSDSIRRHILAAYHVTYVLDGPWETSMGSYSPAQTSYLNPLVFHSGPWTLYRVHIIPGEVPSASARGPLATKLRA